MFHSKEVLQKVSLGNKTNLKPSSHQVQELSKKFGTTPNHIFPVRNYNMETECNLSVDILNLRAQRQILRYSVEYLEDTIALLAAERRTRERELKQDERRRQRMGHQDQDRSMSGAATESEEEVLDQTVVQSRGKEMLLFSGNNKLLRKNQI